MFSNLNIYQAMLQLNIQPHTELLQIEAAPINVQLVRACSVVNCLLDDILFSSLSLMFNFNR